MARLLSFALLLLLVSAGHPAVAQDSGLIAVATHKPRFLAGWSAPGTVVDASNVAVLQRRVTIDVSDQALGVVLRELARQARLDLSYDPARLPAGRTVSLHVRSITMLAALTEVLVNTGLDVVVQRGGQLALVPAPAVAGTIAGRVTDATTGEEIVGAEVFLEGTRRRSTTGENGQYRLVEVEVGSYTLAVRRVGYAKQSRAVTVAEGEEVTVDVALEPVPTRLDEVVTTVTGEQRLRELGHVVGRINADSLVKAAPVSSLSELLNGRVAGLQVHMYQGTVGGEVNLRVRSTNTINLSAEPIVIVDGVRYTSGHTRAPFTHLVNSVEPTSPLNDLNPNQIESIEVVKGPSAATLYGTDAANGVIVITTKRGRPGPARWNAYVKGATTEIPDIRFAERYWGWHTEGGAPSLEYSCLAEYQAGGFCTQDSLTVIRNPLNDPQLSIFKTKPRWEYGANITGGSQDLRYFFAADIEEAIGPLRMPPALADSLAGARGVRELPQDQLEPNALSKLSLRSSVTVDVTKSAELHANVGYGHRSTRGFGSGIINPYGAVYSSTVRPGQPYGTIWAPEQLFARTSTEHASRFFASVSGRWSPTPWLLMRGTGGIDLTSTTRSSLALRDQVQNSDFILGAVGDDRGRQLATTAELAATASFNSGRLSSRTSVGAQYVRTVDDLLISFGTNLPPGGSSIGEASTISARQTYREQVTLGSYVEQVVGLNQRLFLTGALRADGASTFGRNYDAAVYPKASASWLVSEEPLLARLPILDELRLRYAFGASGQQPRPEWARPGYTLEQKLYGGSVTPIYAVNSLGNRNLRPERVREHEFGVDASALANRVELGVTWFRRTTVDQIVNINLPPGLGTMLTNVGLTIGRGFEVQLRARPLESRAISWDLALQHSSHTTTLMELGGAVAQRDPFGGWVEGYPIGARFMRPIVGYDDANGDGIITTAEVQRGDTAVYFGEGTPPRSQTLTSVVSLFDHRLRVSALLERRSGFTQLNVLSTQLCSSELCRAGLDPSAPLAEQAEAAAMRQGYYLIEPGDFTRLREVSVAIDLPARAARALRLSSATVSLHGRNLALWTSYRGPDPESASIATRAGQPVSAAELGIPQSRSWAVRLDVAF